MDIDTVVELNKGLIISCVNKFYNVDKDDLYQAGIVGLLKAYKNYKYDGKTKFSSYAYKYIYGEMYLLVNNNSMKINKDTIKLANTIEKARYSYAQKINKIPSDEELSKFLNIPLSTIQEVSSVTNESISLDDESDSLYNKLSKNEDYDNNILILQGLKYLTEDEKKIIIDRYYNDLTQDEIAKKMELSQVTVSRYEKRSLNKLYDYMKV